MRDFERRQYLADGFTEALNHERIEDAGFFTKGSLAEHEEATALFKSGFEIGRLYRTDPILNRDDE